MLRLYVMNEDRDSDVGLARKFKQVRHIEEGDGADEVVAGDCSDSTGLDTPYSYLLTENEV